MKTKIIPLLLCLTLLLSFSACSQEKHSLLYSEEHNGITYCVRGSKKLAKQIVVKEGDEIIWTKSVKIDKGVGSLNGNYGFEVLDLNFDGYLDLMIVEQVASDCHSYRCWLKIPETNSYELSEELSGLSNIKADPELQAIFAFSHEFEREKEYSDVASTTISTDSTTKYIWNEGVFTPQIKASITFYSESNLYCYSLAYYDEETQQFEDSDDKWLTPEEYKTYDMSFLYYFK